MSRTDAVQRLKSARGHLNAVIRMLEQRRSCSDILHQLNAVERALEHSKRAILQEHLHSCAGEGSRDLDPGEQLEDLLDALYGGHAQMGSRHCDRDSAPHSLERSVERGGQRGGIRQRGTDDPGVRRISG